MNDTTRPTRWTAGRLRAALAQLPDDTPLRVSIPDPDDPAAVDWDFVVTGADRGELVWSDERGKQPTSYVIIACEPTDDDDPEF